MKQPKLTKLQRFEKAEAILSRIYILPPEGAKKVRRFYKQYLKALGFKKPGKLI